MAIAILHDEQGHRRRFEGYLKEYIARGMASKSDLPAASQATAPEEGSAL